MTDVQLLYNEADIKGRIYESTKKFHEQETRENLKDTYTNYDEGLKHIYRTVKCTS